VVVIPKRSQQLLDGLLDFVNYVNSIMSTKEMTICEIGSWCGSSADIFAQHFKNVICIDPFVSDKEITKLYNMRDVEKEFDKIKAKYNNITKLKHYSYAVVNIFDDKSIDIVYIDGEHTYKAVKQDIQLYLPKCKYFISGHDYWIGKFPGVIKAVNECLGKPDKIFNDISWIKELK
jgi:hypothetical protein